MENIFNSIFIYMKKVLLLLGITSIVIIIIFLFLKLKLCDLYLYAGSLYLAIGIFSFMGNIQLSASFSNYQARSISSKSMYQDSVKDQNLRDSGSRFQVFMFISGFALFAISFIMYNLNL